MRIKEPNIRPVANIIAPKNGKLLLDCTTHLNTKKKHVKKVMLLNVSSQKRNWDFLRVNFGGVELWFS